MTVIEEFIARYRKEYDFYDQTARLVLQLLEGNLQAAGIRSIVTSRAKVSLERRKIYAALPDAKAARLGLIRVIDESGDDYLYPEDRFVATYGRSAQTKNAPPISRSPCTRRG